MHSGGSIGQSGDYWGNAQFDDTYYRNGQPEKFAGYATDIWFEEAASYIRSQSHEEQPFFAYISTNAPHTPWRTKVEDIQAYRDLGLTESMSRFYGIDSGVGPICQGLESLGIEDNTLLIFMTDNGTSSLRPESTMFEDLDSERFLNEFRSNPEYADWVINAGIRGFKNDVYEGGHRVHFFLYYPKGKFGEARDQPELLAHVNLLPTLVGLLSIDKGAVSDDVDGLSFASLLDGSSDSPENFHSRKLVVTNQRVPAPRIGRPMVVMSEDWRFVSERGQSVEELYNIKLDPAQSQNLIEEYSEIADEHRVYLDQWWAEISLSFRSPLKPIVGTEHENPVRLNANDWAQAVSTSEIAWKPGFKANLLPEAGTGWMHNVGQYKPLPWEVKVAETAKYRIRTYVQDVPADTPIGQRYAFLEVGAEIYESELSAEASGAEFVVAVEQGDDLLKGWFADDQGQQTATLYMYLEKL